MVYGFLGLARDQEVYRGLFHARDPACMAVVYRLLGHARDHLPVLGANVSFTGDLGDLGDLVFSLVSTTLVSFFRFPSID